MLAAGGVAALAAVPLAQLVLAAAGAGPARAAALLLRPRTVDLLTGSLVLVLATCAGALLLGTATAWAVVRLPLPAPRLWPVLVCLPLAVPSYVAAFAWRATWPQVHGFWPLVLVMVLTTTPYVTVPVVAALAQADHSLAEVARTLGRGRWKAARAVVLPQVLPAAGAGTLLVALYALSDFGAPAVLRHETLTTGVHRLLTGGLDRTAPAVLALALTALALLCVAGERWARRLGSGRRSPAARAAPPVPVHRTTALLVAFALAAVAAASVLGPLAALGRRMLTSERYSASAADLVGAGTTTLALAAVAATAVVVAAVPVSHLAARRPGRLTAALETAATTGHALPGVVVALALAGLWLAVAPAAYQTAVALLSAYAVLFLPKALGTTRTAVEQVPVAAQDAARALGCGPVSAWLRAVLPRALPGLAAGWVLVAAAVSKELPATLVLRPAGMDTLATELWSRTSLGAYGAAAPVGVVLVLVGLVPALLLARSLRQQLPGHLRRAPAPAPVAAGVTGVAR